MRNVVSSQKYIITIALMLILLAAGIVGAYLYGSTTLKGDCIKQFRLTQDVPRGHSIQGKFEEVSVTVKDSVASENLLVNAKDLENAYALTDMYRNESITKSDVGAKEDIERSIDFALPVTIEGALANSISTNDIVAIKVKFEDERQDACVVSSIPIKDIRTSNGEPIVDNSTLPGFLLFTVTDEENINLNSASKEGTLYVVRYTDLSQPKIEENYSKGKTSLDVSGSNTTTADNKAK